MEAKHFLTEFSLRAQSLERASIPEDITISIPASPPMAGWLFLAWVANSLLVPPSATLKMLSCSCFTTTVDIMGVATTLAARYHVTAQHWSYPSKFSFG